MLIDVSNYQGAINWNTAASSVDGAYIKVTEGSSYIDPYWRSNHDGITAAGKPAGAYHFADLGDPVAEANHFADQYLTVAWGLRPVLDIETQGATARWITAFRAQFRARVGNPRFRVYSSRSFFQGALNPAGWIDADTDIWCAAYGSTVGWSHPALVLWQNSDAANIPGITGQVDSDQPMNGWTPAVDIQGGTVTAPGLTPDQATMLADLYEQETGQGHRSPTGAYPGWPTWRVDPIDPKVTALTPVDFLRSVDRETNSRIDIATRATAAQRPGMDTLFGHVVSMRAELAALAAQVGTVASAVAKVDTDVASAVAALQAAITAEPTAAVDPTKVADALVAAGVAPAIVTALLTVLQKAVPATGA